MSANGIGRVEIYFNEVWGTVCDDSWDMSDAMVACRQLGYETAVRPLQGDQVSNGSGIIWLDDVACTGNEKSLLSCVYNWLHDCSHSEDAGVSLL